MVATLAAGVTLRKASGETAPPDWPFVIGKSVGAGLAWGAITAVLWIGVTKAWRALRMSPGNSQPEELGSAGARLSSASARVLWRAYGLMVSAIIAVVLICPPWKAKLQSIDQAVIPDIEIALPWPNPSFRLGGSSQWHSFSTFVSVFSPPRPNVETVGTGSGRQFIGFWVVTVDLLRLGLVVGATIVVGVVVGCVHTMFLPGRRTVPARS